ILAQGERIMAQIMTKLLIKRGLEAVCVDAAEIIKTKMGPTGLVHDPIECQKRIQAKIKPLLEAGKFPVIPGFIAEGPDGCLVTLGRGGSDYTATILAAALEAERVTLYKEVDGMLTADPKYVPKAQLIPELHYQEAAELSFYGAKILHPRSIIPLIKPRIPLYLKNTFCPEQAGTKISHQVTPTKNPVRALTAINNQSLISIEGCGMMGVPGVAMRTFKALSEAAISVSLISQASSEASICLTISGESQDLALEALRKEFHFELSNQLIERIQALDQVAIVAVVGMGMKGSLGLSARVFGAFRYANLNIIAIAQGSSEFNISMVIRESQVPLAIQTLHHEFFGSQIPNEAQIAIHGFGQIGQALASQLLSQKDYLQQEFGVSINIKAVSDSKGFCVLEHSDLPSLIERKKQGEQIHEQAGLLDFQKLEITHGICVDLTASASHQVLMQALENNFDIVLANKKPLTGPYVEYEALFQKAREKNCQIRYEATVGAGLPIIDTIDKLKQAGDAPLCIQGCFSGTLGYLMSALDTDICFSEAVKHAQALGLTEPDPNDDLAGTDVARKALILARELDWKLELSDIETESLVGISDAEFKKRVLNARESNKRLRYIAQVIPGKSIRVGLQEVGPESPFYYLVGTTNQVSMKTPRYLESPLIVTGPGAGAGVTAAGVLNDVVALAVRSHGSY
ncbi:MAG: aspartate kinase, partial [Myxococcaceae bacterium]